MKFKIINKLFENIYYCLFFFTQNIRVKINLLSPHQDILKINLKSSKISQFNISALQTNSRRFQFQRPKVPRAQQPPPFPPEQEI